MPYESYEFYPHTRWPDSEKSGILQTHEGTRLAMAQAQPSSTWRYSSDWRYCAKSSRVWSRFQAKLVSPVSGTLPRPSDPRPSWRIWSVGCLMPHGRVSDGVRSQHPYAGKVDVQKKDSLDSWKAIIPCFFLVKRPLPFFWLLRLWLSGATCVILRFSNLWTSHPKSLLQGYQNSNEMFINYSKTM